MSASARRGSSMDRRLMWSTLRVESEAAGRAASELQPAGNSESAVASAMNMSGNMRFMRVVEGRPLSVVKRSCKGMPFSLNPASGFSLHLAKITGAGIIKCDFSRFRSIRKEAKL